MDLSVNMFVMLLHVFYLGFTIYYMGSIVCLLLGINCGSPGMVENGIEWFLCN